MSEINSSMSCRSPRYGRTSRRFFSFLKDSGASHAAACDACVRASIAQVLRVLRQPLMELLGPGKVQQGIAELFQLFLGKIGNLILERGGNRA